MFLIERKGAIAEGAHRYLEASRGLQLWLLEASRTVVARELRRVAESLVATPEPPAPPQAEAASVAQPAPTALEEVPLPRTPDDIRALFSYVRRALDNLDDVEDYLTVGEVDDDIYQLWRELERKMQVHRQAEAKFQLKDIFRI